MYHMQFTVGSLSLCDPNKFINWMHLGVYGRWRNLDWVSETSEFPFVCLQPNKIMQHLKCWNTLCVQGCSLDSAEVERLYQINPQSQVSFTAGRQVYTLDFSGKILLYCIHNPLYTGLCIINMRMILLTWWQSHDEAFYKMKLPNLRSYDNKPLSFTTFHNARGYSYVKQKAYFSFSIQILCKCNLVIQALHDYRKCNICVKNIGYNIAVTFYIQECIKWIIYIVQKETWGEYQVEASKQTGMNPVANNYIRLLLYDHRNPS